MLLSISNYIVPQQILKNAKHSYYSFPLYVQSDEKYRNRLIETLDKDFNIYCATGYANPLPLYLCVNALIDPLKYGRGLKYSDYEYPEGMCPNAEELLKKSFLIPFNENFSDYEIIDIGSRLIQAVEKLK